MHITIGAFKFAIEGLHVPTRITLSSLQFLYLYHHKLRGREGGREGE